MNRRLLALATLTTATLLATSANAITYCAFVDTPQIAFGQYDVFSDVPLDAAGTFSYECVGIDQNDLIVVELSMGAGSGNGMRAMSNGPHSLAYNVYLDAARTIVWGDGSNGTSAYGPVKPNPGTNTVWIYGRIFARQNVTVGTYSDTLTVTIVY